MNTFTYIWNILGILIVLFLVVSMFVPYIQRRVLIRRRYKTMKLFENRRNSRLVTMIHRQEAFSFFGLRFSRFIDIEDSEQVLRVIRMTPPEMPIDLVLHTPGGLVLASEQIACALKRHQGRVTVFVPHYAMSGGTLIAMAADEIIMDPDAVLGPVDPQLGSSFSGSYPAASIISALEQPNPNRDDQTLILGDVAKKAINQVYEAVYSLAVEKMPADNAEVLAKAMSSGRWTHDYPISFAEAKELGLSVDNQLPKEIYDLMELYPQSGQRRPSVEFVPTPYLPPTSPTHK